MESDVSTTQKEYRTKLDKGNQTTLKIRVIGRFIKLNHWKIRIFMLMHYWILDFFDLWESVEIKYQQQRIFDHDCAYLWGEGTLCLEDLQDWSKQEQTMAFLVKMKDWKQIQSTEMIYSLSDKKYSRGLGYLLEIGSVKKKAEALLH